MDTSNEIYKDFIKVTRPKPLTLKQVNFALYLLGSQEWIEKLSDIADYSYVFAKVEGYVKLKK